MRLSRLLAAVLLLAGTAASARAQPAESLRQPARHGFDPDTLANVLERAEDLDPLNSLLIARGDTLVGAYYAPGMEPDAGVNAKSASKTVLSALVGIALEEGHLDSLQQPIGPFFPEILEGRPRRQQITLDDLLTMRAGLESTSFGNYGAWVTSDNWVRDALTRPLVQPPGEGEMIYSTGTSHLVSVILTKATETPTRRYAQSRLFDPLGVDIKAWQQDPQGYYFGGNNMRLSPRALLRFGQLYLDGGRWEGEQVVPDGWVERSWRVRVTESYRGFWYGLFWWIEELGGRRTYFAWGYGGQFVFVVPSLDLVAVMTSSLSDRPEGLDDHSGRLIRFAGEAVIPAAAGGVASGR
jgi:CubicO group peptidase (beta-lactamase class C family)